MAEYNTNRLYWIKLTDRFMTSDTVDYLMSQKDGANYVVLYQMLCLKTVNQNGVLARKLGEIIIPYDEVKIVRDCKYFSIDTVRIALTLYKNLGLIYEQADGLFRIADFERLIGSTTEGAEKKQIQREKSAQKTAQIAGGQSGGQKVDICPPDKERDIERELLESKKVSNKNNNARTRARERFENDGEVYPGDERYLSHQELMTQYSVPARLREVLTEFLRNCYLNKHIISNETLGGIIVALELKYKDDEQAKINSVRKAIRGGYISIKEWL